MPDSCWHIDTTDLLPEVLHVCTWLLFRLYLLPLQKSFKYTHFDTDKRIYILHIEQLSISHMFLNERQK